MPAPVPAADLVVRRPEGLYCPAGDFFIDPWRKVERAVITHAHADHARTGHGRYLCAARGLGVLRARLGPVPARGLAWGEPLQVGGVRVSLHPAGHILGAAQVRLEVAGQVWVVAGDFFASTLGDVHPTCDPFEPVPCHCFITEATFGSPIYRWPRQAAVADEMLDWWAGNREAGEASLLQGYSLGKTQHLMARLAQQAGGVLPGPLYVHPSAEAINAAHAAEGVALPTPRPWGELERAGAAAGALVIAPPQAQAPWRWQPGLRVREAFASGWTLTHAGRRRGGLDRGFVLSDHADWPGLLMAVAATGCEQVIVTHGDERLLEQAFAERGLATRRFRTAFGTDAAAEGGPEG